MRQRISAFVVSYNRAPLIGTCLRPLRFADEVIVVDKSSTDETPAIAARHADRVITVPWSPTVEETRAFAAAQCAHDWILYLDDDECLNPEAVRFIQDELTAPRADIYALPLRHYILGVHDEAAYYWPQHHVRLVRRDAVAFSATEHAGITLRSDRVLRIAPESGVAIHHLSNLSVAEWVEKTNRYTARADRARVEHDGEDLIRFAHQRIDHWMARTRNAAPGGYPAAAALLRATYDLVDRLKTWEEERGLDAAGQIRRFCADLDAAHAALGSPRPRGGETRTATPPPANAPPATVGQDALDVLRKQVAGLRARHDALTTERDARAAEAAVHAAEAARFAASLSVAHEALDAASGAMEADRQRALQAEAACNHALAEAATQKRRADAIEASGFWRSKSIPRRLAERARRLTGRAGSQ